MIQFRLHDIPVRIQPWFFLTAALIGPHDLRGMLLWVPVVLVGVLAHELGHAAAVRRAGGAPAIELHGFGGLTSWRAAGSLRPIQRIGISAAGPATGLLIGAATIVALRAMQPHQPIVVELLRNMLWVNLGWGLLNLLPILPLDGGMIVGTVAEAAWGRAGRRIARIISLAACIVLGLMALLAGWLWSAIIAGVLAMANLQSLRSDSDS